ncbi:MAG TPA: 3-dehydroquinate synthase [Pyrinomonadaceae bacterium]|nr:3-dehydroquinate synthase [Pyrinomonadaceae bacterium]
MRTVRVRLGARDSYDILAGPGALARLGEAARGALRNRARRVVIVSNETVLGLYGRRAAASLRASGFGVETFLAGDGERHKTLREAERALDFFSRRRLERTDAVVALGGGVVGDLAGFAASVYLRGVAFIQVPTTLLAQIDAAVGGKTGVNARAGKNLIGTFHQPRAVVADTDALRTLPPRELTAGWCEAVKHGAVAGPRLFKRTRDFLAAGGADVESLADLIAEHCAFKARVVAADERERLEGDGARGRPSRRVLNFGHTVGHALEAVTRYRRFRHGEAVGHGMVVAAEISKRLGLLDAAGLQSLREAVALAGPLPRADDLDASAVLAAAEADKKSAGGQLHWVLLEGIGRARVVPAREVPARVVREAIRAGLAPAAGRNGWGEEGR